MEPAIDVLIRCLIAAPVLALAAVVYDHVIEHLDRQGHLDGYTSLAVAAGVAGVLLVGLWVAWPLGVPGRVAVALVFGLFVPAGLPMILGSIRRHVAARSRDRAQAQAQAQEALR